MALRREIPEGGLYPGSWYGVAWDEWTQNGVRVVCYPMPLNIIFRFFHRIYMEMRAGWPCRAWGASYLCRQCREKRPFED